MYLVKNKRNPLVAVVPATFMSAVTMTCIISSDLYLGKLLPGKTMALSNVLGLSIAAVFLFMFTRKAIQETGLIDKLKK